MLDSRTWKKRGKKMVKSKESKGSGKVTRKVVLVGLKPIMFDPYPGDNKTQLPNDRKMYLGGEAGKTVTMPVVNLFSFLAAVNTRSATKVIIGRGYRDICQAANGFIEIEPDDEIPFTRKGKPVIFHGFDEDNEDKKSGIYVSFLVARLEKGIPNPKERPVLTLPWELHFNITLIDNPILNEIMLKKIFVDGGMIVGLGTYRGRYGKFKVQTWE